MKSQLEYELQKQVCKYLDFQYPKVLFMTDSIAAVKLTIPQQMRNKAVQKQGFKCPDLIIFQPSKYFNGMFLELKVKSPYKSDGFTLLKNEHIEEQAKTMDKLKKLGYFCKFVWTFEYAKGLIDNYMADAKPC